VGGAMLSGRFWLSAAVLSVARAQDGSALFESDVPKIGNTADTVPSCMSYERSVCTDGGANVVAQDAASPGLVAYYTFDDSAGLDTSGLGNHAKVSAPAGPGHGPAGFGAMFDGSRMMEVPRSADFESNDLTISFWMYLLEDSTNSYRTIFRKAEHAADMTPALMLLPMDRRLHVRLATTGTVTTGFDSTAVIPLRRWTHVAFILKGGAALTLYVNGVKDCPVLGSNRHCAIGCPPGGATYAWDEGEVIHNKGSLYIGGDPFMSGAAMYIDEFKVFNKALPERDILLEANDALGMGSLFIKIGCTNCTETTLQENCADLETYHPCLCQELMGGGLTSARAMGWLRGKSSEWRFHAVVQNPATCDLVDATTGDDPKPGFCCLD